MIPLRHIDCFSGVGGIATGFHAAGIHTVLAIEKIKSCIDTYTANHPNIKVINTGNKTMTGGRILRLQKYFKKNENFFMTYGDGLSNVNLDKLKKFHELNNKLATVTAVRPPIRFGELNVAKRNIVKKFEEKPQLKYGWINGGFFILNYEVFKYIKNDHILFEREPMERLAKKKNLIAFKHKGFWKCVDTLKDKLYLDELYKKNKKKWIP